MKTVQINALPPELENKAFFYIQAIDRMRKGISQMRIKHNRYCRDVRHIVRAIYQSENRRNIKEVNIEKLRSFVQKRIDPEFRTEKWTQRVDLIIAALRITGALRAHNAAREEILTLEKDDPLFGACIKGTK